MLCKDHAVFSKVTAGGLCSLPQLWVGEPLARRKEAQAGTGRGRLPPHAAALEVTPPQADEPRNRRKDFMILTSYECKLFNAPRSKSQRIARGKLRSY